MHKSTEIIRRSQTPAPNLKTVMRRSQLLRAMQEILCALERERQTQLVHITSVGLGTRAIARKRSCVICTSLKLCIQEVFYYVHKSVQKRCLKHPAARCAAVWARWQRAGLRCGPCWVQTTSGLPFFLNSTHDDVAPARNTTQVMFTSCVRPG